MYEEALEILDKINFEEVPHLKEQEDSESVRLRLSAYIKGGDIMTLCEMVAEVRLSTHEGFSFLFGELTDNQVYKLFILLDAHTEAEEIPYNVKLACAMAMNILADMLKTPCQISLEIDEVGYFQAIEDKLGLYIPREEFDEAHEKCHRLIDLIATTSHIGGWIRGMHKN